MTIVAAVSFAACGTDPSLVGRQAARACFGCAEQAEALADQLEEPQPLPAPSPSVAAWPIEVMFYGTSDSTSVTDPRHVTISNETSSTVAITNVYIVDHDGITSDTHGDADFFAVHDPPLGAPIDEGESTEVSIEFTASSELRTALLVIETTHPAYESLVVTLAGKVFIGW